MGAPYNPNVDLEISRSGGVHPRRNGRRADNTYTAQS